MSKEFNSKITTNAEFELKPGQTLIINFYKGLSDLGMDRIVAKFDEKGEVVNIRATGHGSFEFERRKDGADPSFPEFILQNPDIKVTFKDYLTARFWGQFTWGEMIKLHDDKKFARKVSRKIDSLVKEFEEKAIEELNNIDGIPSRIHKPRRKRQSPKS